MLAIALALVQSVGPAVGAPTVPKISAVPLNREQRMVYRTFLSQYRNGQSILINVVELTGILQPDDGDYAGCMKGFPRSIPQEVHHFPQDFLRENRLHAVDPQVFKIDDPETAIQNGQPIDSSVQRAFGNALMYLSEVIFDAKNHRAAFNYTVRCGRLCGHSETVVYEKHNGNWKRSNRSCGYGIY